MKHIKTCNGSLGKNYLEKFRYRILHYLVDGMEKAERERDTVFCYYLNNLSSFIILKSRRNKIKCESTILDLSHSSKVGKMSQAKN